MRTFRFKRFCMAGAGALALATFAAGCPRKAANPPPPAKPAVKSANLEIAISGNVKLEMVKVEGGTFEMDQDSSKSRHEVTLKDFYIGKTEVTQEQYQMVMDATPSKCTGNS